MKYYVWFLVIFTLLFCCPTYGHSYPNLFTMLFPELDPVPFDVNTTNLSTECQIQIAEIALQDPKTYQTMLTSWGRTLGDSGKWWQCTDIPSATYCLATMNITSKDQGEDGDDQSFSCSYKLPECNIGVCVPNDCQSDISEILSQGMITIGTLLNTTVLNRDISWIANCQVDNSIVANPKSWVGITTLSIIVFTAVGATIIHMIMNGTLHTLISRVEIEEDVPPNTDVRVIPSKLDVRKPSIQLREDSNEELELKVIGESTDELREGDINLDEELSFDVADDETLIIDEEDIDHHEGHSLLIDENESFNPYQDEIVQEDVGLQKKIADVIPPVIGKIAKCFSISENFEKLLNPIPGDFGSLNALRCFSMFWVIWGHTLFFWAQIGAANLGYAYNEFIHQFYIQAAMSGIFAVDSFFFLSGFLGSYFLYERLLDGKRMEWALIYFHRIWRILPVYTFIMLIYVTMIQVLGDGPFWFKLYEVIEHTSHNCWSNLIFINNMYPPNSADQCMGWGWFLAVDMQFFMVTPPLIYIQYKKPIIGWILLSIWLAQDLTTSTVLSAVRGYSPSIITPQPHFFEQFYQRPYCRAAPYIVGLSSGYLFSYIRRNKPNFKIPMPAVILGYIISFSTIFVIVFSIYWDDQWNQFENSLYLGFSRFAWGLSIAYINLSMFLGYGGIIRKFFFARLWQPLAKLTYGAYLSHPLFMWLYYFNQWTWIMVENRNFWYLYISHAFCAFTFAVIAYLLIEKPFMNLEPMLVKGVIGIIFKILKKPLPSEFK